MHNQTLYLFILFSGENGNTKRVHYLNDFLVGQIKLFSCSIPQIKRCMTHRWLCIESDEGRIELLVL